MVGKWAWVSPTELEQFQPNDCPEAEFFGQNGYVTTGDDVAQWRIEGDELVSVIVEPMEGEEAGGIYRQQFTRVAPGILQFSDPDSTQLLVRCGDVPPEWEYRPAA